MAESITITESETGPDAPVAEQDNSTRPEWLPEKFATVEDMAKSYGELEKKLSGPSEEPQEPEAVEEAEAPKSEGPNFDKFSQQFADDGSLSDESFSELEGMGYPREMVETYIKGMQSAQTADTDAVMSVAGGSEGYQELTEWAKANMETNELELYNNMVGTSTDNAKMAVEWLMSKREASGGVEPTLLSGKSAAPAKDEFRSTAEVVAAMKDARYGKDSAYTKDVEEKLGRSSVF